MNDRPGADARTALAPRLAFQVSAVAVIALVVAGAVIVRSLV